MPRVARECAAGTWSVVPGFMKVITLTNFPQKNEVVSNDRSGSLRAAMFLSVPIIIHAVGNLQVSWGLQISLDTGTFCMHLRWTGLGLEANIVEEYMLRAALVHVFHPRAPRCSRSWRFIYFN